MELCGSKVQPSTPHRNFINDVANPEIACFNAKNVLQSGYFTIHKLMEDWKESNKNKGQCTTGPTATTVQSSQQLNFWKSQFWAQNLTFWLLEGLGKSFPEDNIYIVWNALLLSNFMQKIEKFWHAVRKQSLKKSSFGPNLTFWPCPQGSRAFFEN